MSKFYAAGTQVYFDSYRIGRVTSVTLPSRSRGEVDFTDNDSDQDSEFSAGTRDNGTVTIEYMLDFTDQGQAALRANFESNGCDVVGSVEIHLPECAGMSSDNDVISFSGFVSALDGDLPMVGDEAATGTATIRVSGAIEFPDVSI